MEPSNYACQKMWSSVHIFRRCLVNLPCADQFPLSRTFCSCWYYASSTCAASILRFVYVVQFQYKDPSCEFVPFLSCIVIDAFCPNLTYLDVGTIAYPLLWSCVEVSLGVASVCIPSLKPWFTIILGTKGHGTVRVLAPFKFNDDSSGSSRAATLVDAAPVSERRTPSTTNQASSIISDATLDEAANVRS